MTAVATTPTSRTRAGGYVHAAGWVAGLAVGWGATPEAGDSHAEIATAYADHPAQAIGQALLTHGVAAAGLAVVAAGLLRWARRTGSRAARTAGWAGTAAAALACVQLLLELVSVPGADPASPGTAGTLFDAGQRVDGVKMFALAVLAAGACAATRHATLLRRWESLTGWALAAAITLSGIGYVLLSDALMPVAFVSLPLLLVWIVALGTALARAGGGVAVSRPRSTAGAPGVLGPRR
jgi:hypothetical protein